MSEELAPIDIQHSPFRDSTEIAIVVDFIKAEILHDPVRDEERLRQGLEDSTLLTVHSGVDTLGFAVLKLSQMRDNTGEIKYMGVFNGYRASGFGGLLIGAVESCFKDQGMTELTVIPESESARHFYEQNGFSSGILKMQKHI